MNRKEAQVIIDNLEIVKAFAEGKTIQYIHQGQEFWVDTPHPTFSEDVRYRIKPSLKPFTQDDIIKRLSYHPILIRFKQTNRKNFVETIHGCDDNDVHVTGSANTVSYETLLEKYEIVNSDGIVSPCGKLP